MSLFRACLILHCLFLAGIYVHDFGSDRYATSDSGSPERGRRAGVLAAVRDLADGTPVIRRLLETDWNIGSDGIGIDIETGLPLANTWLMCGAGVDFVAYGAEIEEYNRRIMAAHTRGELGHLSLRRKLRTTSALRAMFAAGRPQRLAKEGDRIAAANGEFVLAYEVPHSDCCFVMLTRQGGEPATLRLLNPAPFAERPDTLSGTWAPGPFDLLIADGDTTAILKDADGFAWIVDLSRGVVVQVIRVGS